MKRLFLFLFAAMLGITQVWGAAELVTVNFSAQTGGTVQGYYNMTGTNPTSSFSSGKTFTLTNSKNIKIEATPSEGYEFDSWTVTSTISSFSYTTTASTKQKGVVTFSTGSKIGTITVTASFTYVGGGGDDDDDDDDTTPKYVDLGLPSGTLWADRNLGAASETETGDYYAYGETSTKTTYSSTNVTFDPTAQTMPQVDRWDNNEKDYYYLPTSKDVAYKTADGGVWRMPTKGEMKELLTNCSVKAENGGYRLTSKITGYTDKSIFIPATGYKSSSSTSSTSDAYFWTSTLGTSSNKNAYYGYIYTLNYNPKIGDVSERSSYYGQPIRPVFIPTGTTFKATFKVEGMEDKTVDVAKGGTPTVPTFTKDATDTYTYSLKPWNPTVSKISVPTTYTSSFTATPIDFNITYNLQGGSVASANPVKYNVESNAITLNNPTKLGYDFAGWTGTGLDGAQMTVVIPKGSKGARSYTATWTEVTALTLVDDKNAGDSWYTWLEGCEDKILDVTYQRTFPVGTTAEPSWSVFSLPFEYYIDKAGATFADKVLNMDHATYEGEILSIYCTYETLKIEANRPYILYNTGAEIVNPVFANVAVQTLAENSYDKPCTAGGTVIFKNTTCYQQLPENKNILFIGNNQLYYPGDATYLRAFRGYFVLDGVRAAGAPKRVRLMVNETTGLESNMQNEQQSATEKVVENGALYIIRNGVRYDARGAEIR